MKRLKILPLIAVLILSAVFISSCGREALKAKKTTEKEDAAEVGSVQPETEETGEKETDEKEADPDAERSSNAGLEALRLAEKLIGTEYALGGVGPDKFDNSGFIYYIFKECGVDIPRLTPDIANFGKAVSRADVAPGDILVFSNEIGGGPAFVAIYAGDGNFIACFKPEKPTQLQPMGDYWDARFITARRAG